MDHTCRPCSTVFTIGAVASLFFPFFHTLDTSVKLHLSGNETTNHIEQPISITRTPFGAADEDLVTWLLQRFPCDLRACPRAYREALTHRERGSVKKCRVEQGIDTPNTVL